MTVLGAGAGIGSKAVRCGSAVSVSLCASEATTLVSLELRFGGRAVGRKEDPRVQQVTEQSRAKDGCSAWYL